MRGKSHTGDSWNSGFISRKNLNGLKFFLLLSYLLKPEAGLNQKNFREFFTHVCIFYSHDIFLKQKTSR